MVLVGFLILILLAVIVVVVWLLRRFTALILVSILPVLYAPFYLFTNHWFLSPLAQIFVGACFVLGVVGIIFGIRAKRW